MTGEEFVLALLAIIMGSVVFIVGIAKITELIQSWIKRNKGGYDEETFNRLATAFMQHKKKTERRIQNLEAIITGDDGISNGSQKIDNTPQPLEIKEQHETNLNNESEKDDRKLRNMLKS